MKPSLEQPLLHLNKRVRRDDPADGLALQPLHVDGGVDQVALQDLGGERVQGLQVEVVGEEGEHRRVADGDAGVAEVKAQLNLNGNV